MFSDLKYKHGDGNYTFVQDGAPAHKSYLTKLFLKKRCNFLKSWPPNSPDLNPIEHLWGAMKRILKNHKILSKSDFIQTIQKIWEEFPQSKIDSLVQSFTKRLKRVISNDGNSISDELRNGINNLPDDDIEIDPNINLL